jgi:hypothetical protein
VSTIVYLGAVGRSGTTLLERVAATSPSCVSLGEMVHLWQRGALDDESCGCGLPIHQCPTWTAVMDVAFGGWTGLDAQHVRTCQQLVDRNRFIPFLLWPRLARPPFRVALAELIGVLDRVYAAIAQVAGPDVVMIDASKHPSYYFLLRRLPSHDVRLLHVVRDPRGVAHSWAKTVQRPEQGDDMERLGTWRAIARWSSHNVLFSLAGLRRRHALLRYERFADEPDELGRVLATLLADRTIEPPVIDGRTVELRVDHTVSGNPMRFRTGPIDIRSDDGWRSAMPRMPRLIVTIFTAPLRLGYRL